MTKATQRIKKLRLSEVSLVGDGDNPNADVLILKHREIVGVDLDVVKQRLAEVRTDAVALAKELSEGGFDMNIEELTAKLGEIEKSLTTVQSENTALKGQVETITKERDAAVADLEKARKKIPAKEQADGGADDPDADDVMKDLPKAVRERIEKSLKEADELREQITKERDQREEGEEIAKVRASGLEGADKYGALIHRVRKGKSTAQDADALHDLIAKAKAVSEEGKALFVAIGKADGRDISGGAADAQAKLNEAISAIQKGKPGLSREQAYMEALEANPALYDEVRKIKPKA